LFSLDVAHAISLSHTRSDLLTTLGLDAAQLLPLVGSDAAKRVLKNHVLQVCAEKRPRGALKRTSQ
jgi:hypothetical protein